MVEFERSRPPASEALIESFERTLPAPLPGDYRLFLLERNGGDLAPNWWPPEHGEGSAVDALYGLGEVARIESLVATRDVFEGRIPEDLLAIGYDGMGGQTCVRLIGDDRGSVWFYDPEFELDEEEPPAPELLTRVCGSFTELLETLESRPELEEMERRYSAAQEDEHEDVRGGENSGTREWRS